MGGRPEPLAGRDVPTRGKNVRPGPATVCPSASDRGGGSAGSHELIGVGSERRQCRQPSVGAP
jgi:hypothetical protein